MKTVVITGSTRGIGFGLADSFLSLGCSVGVSGRTAGGVGQATAILSADHGHAHLYGCPCDVIDPDQVQALWDGAEAHFGRVDIWINNAGIGHAQDDFGQLSPELIRQVVETNLIGAMYGARVALNGMLAQGHGAIYNVEGLGSGGPKVRGLALYASTKAGLRYLTDALVAESKGTPVIVGALWPGMVTTRLLTQQYDGRPEEWDRAKPILSILANPVETVAPWLARRVLENGRHGARIKWSNPVKLAGRFLAAPFRRRDPFERSEPINGRRGTDGQP